MNKIINVLVVEDSPVAQLLLVHILNSHPRLRVLGTANNGEEALEFLKRNKPDVIVMDIHMPGMDGYETTRRIMETQPVPIVVCSASLNPAEVAKTFRALEAGAVAIVAKPVGLGHQEYENMAAKLVETVRLMSEVKVVKRWPRLRRIDGQAAVSPPADVKPADGAIKVVALGTSTGGPPVLQTILAGLPKDFPIPVLIVQHIAAGFLPGLVDWLTQTTGYPIQIAAHGEALLPGHAYLAPDGYHLGLGGSGQIALSKQDPENGLRPSVSYLFRSVAAVCGANAVGVLLTGMGRDGADELKLLKELGAATIAQDAESSVVHGMPGEAIKLGAATYVLPPDKIPAVLVGLAPSQSNAPGAAPRPQTKGTVYEN
jgi:two-component system, chemotaxis family, protein-glutamate methylesterase/glutaminase